MSYYYGQRCSAATAYLHPAMSRPNLTVHTDALVTKVIIEGGQATGVSYLHHGEPQTARANAEVILSGGAVNSPQLLMLSGIGPAEHLIEMGIDVHADIRGVGGNLSDHPVLPVIWSTPQDPRPVGEGQQHEPAALAADPPRPADQQRGGVRRLRPLRARAASARPAAARAARRRTRTRAWPTRPGAR